MIALKLFMKVNKGNKKYLRATISQTRLSNLSILLLAIEHEAIQNINFDEVISEFATIKARKKRF